jgi:hypothetical protein
MSWIDLFARASDSAALAQWLLEHALAAANAAQDSALEAAMATELPTAFALCAELDSRGVAVPAEVRSKFCGHLAPAPIRAASHA